MARVLQVALICLLVSWRRYLPLFVESHETAKNAEHIFVRLCFLSMAYSGSACTVQIDVVGGGRRE